MFTLPRFIRQPYQYTPLTDNKSIRIVTLLPGNPGSQIKCEIEEDKLDNILTPYWVLSYGCGNPDVVHPSGLLRDHYEDFHGIWIANSDRPIRIWIDAICINRAEERNQQVQLMKQIFERAEHVVAWLGPSDQDSESAFRKLVQLRTWYDQKAQTLNNQGVSKTIFETIPRSDEAICGYQTGPLDLGEGRSLKSFFERDS